MNNYYTYIYYNADWIAYYVGKGRRNRRRVKREIEVPPNERIQVFPLLMKSGKHMNVK